MKTLIVCKNCGSTFSGDSAWRGAFVTCPYCHRATFFGFDDKCSKTNDNTMWMVLGGIGLAFILLLCIIAFGIWAGARGEQINDSYVTSINHSTLSLQGEIAKDYIENELPYSQRRALMGGGSSEDKANAISNLLKSGNLSGAIEYLESNEK